MEGPFDTATCVAAAVPLAALRQPWSHISLQVFPQNIEETPEVMTVDSLSPSLEIETQALAIELAGQSDEAVSF